MMADKESSADGIPSKVSEIAWDAKEFDAPLKKCSIHSICNVVTCNLQFEMILSNVI